MYPALHAAARPDHPAVIMANSGETITYAELEARSNRLAHLLRALGLSKGDHYALFLENHPRFIECYSAGDRSGLYTTPINSHLTASELAYIVNNSLSKVLITSKSRREVAMQALQDCPGVEICLIVDGDGDGARVCNLEEATRSFPSTPIADESRGAPMLYSSGTTGRPKGVMRPLPLEPLTQPMPIGQLWEKLFRYRPGQIYLAPAPLYHVAPLVGAAFAIRVGGTIIVMERFDPEPFLALIEQYRVTHCQLVPTMFARLLKLPEATRRRYDHSSLEVAYHGAAPCPIAIKQAMIDWWARSFWNITAPPKAWG